MRMLRQFSEGYKIAPMLFKETLAGDTQAFVQDQ